MSPGKLFTQPLFVLLAASFLLWLVLRARLVRQLGTTARRMVDSIGFCLVLLAILSMPITGRLIEQTLQLDLSEIPPPVDAIVVMAGGYAQERDVLSSDSTLRVLAGVEWWKASPAATLVMAGESATPDPLEHKPMTTLMTELAQASGVPAERILLDTWSTNTREHPLGVLKLRGISPETRLGIVTSRWHLRRATIEFRRHFVDVEPWYPMRRHLPVEWHDFIPQVDGIAYSTPLIQEWIGITWYVLLHTLGK